MRSIKHPIMRRRRQTLLLSAFALCFCSLPLLAQGSADDGDLKKLRQKGAAHLQAGEWNEAIEVFGALTSEVPEDKSVWFHLGFAQHVAGLYDAANSSYETMLGITGFHPLNSVAMYNLGCTHALTGDADKAFAWLDKSVAAGFNQTAQVTSDGDLVSLRTDARFAQLVESVDRNAHPCKYKEGARDLDFWVGKWDVYTPTGQQAGKNEIIIIHDECVVHESWNGTLGMNGTSYNFYDNAIGKWRQTWVDDQGGSLLYIGEIVDGAMVYERSMTDAEGRAVLSQMVLTPNDDGTVTQEGRSSVDEGESWATNWKLVYHRRDDGHDGHDHDAHGGEG